jgi:hypothetical protein
VSSQIISRQLIGATVPQNNDQVIAFVPIPPGGSLNNVWLDVSVQTTAAFPIVSAPMYGVSGFVVGLEDPDSSHSYDFIWDHMITKDIAEGYNILSIDTGTSVNDPEFEVGRLDLFQIFGDNLQGNMQIYQRRELLTFPKRPVAYDPSNDSFFPMDAFKVHIAHGPSVSKPSVAMFGFSSPAMDQTQAFTIDSLGATPTEQEWIFTMYAEVFLYDAWKHLIGVVDGASDEPYNAVSAWFAKLMEDKMWESGPGFILPGDYYVHTKATWDISVPGKPGKVALTSD